MMMTKRMWIAGLAAVAAIGVAAPVVHATSTSESTTQVAATSRHSTQEIRAQFTGWNRALATLDANKVADRYAPDAVLLPTVSNQVRTDRAGIVDYFEHFLENHPQGTILKSHVKFLNRNAAIDTGTYRFSLDGGERTVDARYTFVYERIGGKWLIVNHHSSAMPEA
jgi:uncharacterized protein (TIGR02246 family)